MFFFSSRRRHTRLVSDWSSDVCSSDLGEPGNQQVSINRTGIRNRNHPSTECHGGPEECDARSEKKGGPLESARSEERRVGKECRSRGTTDQQKKKNSARTMKEEKRDRK